jgi:hypothetical protein
MNSDHTLEEVGLQFSVTRERIRQIEAKALRHTHRLHHELSFLQTLVLCSRYHSCVVNGGQRLACELPTKRRHAEVAVHPLAALVPSAGTILN